jgi:hypothetical protein
VPEISGRAATSCPAPGLEGQDVALEETRRLVEPFARRL